MKKWQMKHVDTGKWEMKHVDTDKWQMKHVDTDKWQMKHVDTGKWQMTLSLLIQRPVSINTKIIIVRLDRK